VVAGELDHLGALAVGEDRGKVAIAEALDVSRA